jgi:DNA-binding transcriptional LysR family regulator
LLLTRNTRSVHLTEAGQRFYNDCKRILNEIDDANEAAAGIDAVPRGHLTITASVVFGERAVTPIVVEFLREYPDVDIKCVFVDRVVNMQDEGIDVAIRIAPLPPHQGYAEHVGFVSRVVCAAPSYLQQHGTPKTPQDLLEHRLIHAQTVGDWRFLENGEVHTLDIKPPLIVNSNHAAIYAATRAWGITRVMNYQIASLLRDGRLKVLLSDYQLPPVPIHVMCPEGRRLSSKTKRFVEFCVSRLRANKALNEERGRGSLQ